MKKVLVGMLLGVISLASIPLTTNGEYELNRAGAVQRKYNSGTQLYNAQQLGLKGTYNFSTQGGVVGTSYNLLDREGLPVKLPSGAIVTDCIIHVPTTVTSDGNAELEFRIKSNADIKGATGKASFSSSAKLDCVPDGTAAAAIVLASESTLSVKVNVASLTAGKINVWLEYVLSE